MQRITDFDVTRHWMIVERVENWEADRNNRFSFFGLPRRYRKIASEIRKGDRLYCYVSRGIGAFADIRVVRDAEIKEMQEDSWLDIYHRVFEYYFTIRPLLVVPREKWLPLSQMTSALEFTRDRSPASIRALFQTSIRGLSAADAETLTRAMQAAAGSEANYAK